MTDQKTEGLTTLQQYAIYATGLFTLSTSHMVAVVVPLWVLTMGPTALMMGIVLGSRAVLPLILSIHGGALMDRLGARLVMLICTVLGIAVSISYPMLPWLPAVVVLQLLGGMSENMAWIGGQTMVGQLLKGDPVHAGRLSFSTRLGGFIGPPLIGAAWDFIGVWGAFLLLASWMGILLACVLVLPKPVTTTPAPSIRIRDLMPRYRDYVSAFALLASPVLAVVMAVSMLRIGNVAIQNSFYVVYLNGIDLLGTQIGTLLAVSNGMAVFSTVMTGPFVRIIGNYWFLVITSVFAVGAMGVTPIAGTFVLLLLAAAVRGTAMGASQTVLISTTSKATHSDDQGKAVGLRSTANLFAHAILPPIMGAVIDLIGMDDSFLVICSVLIAGILIAGFLGRKTASIVK
jgi:MFS family permease